MKLSGGIAGIALLLAAKSAHAFCGFYVAGADAQLVADASQVVLMREGTRTVLSMQNDYKGPLSDFAMVVPVPVVLQQENVKTLPKDVFARVDALGAPRLVEYWEQDPCATDRGEGIGLGNIGTIGRGSGFGSGHGRLGGAVTIEAQFEVGEYEIVILSTKDASALEQWLNENHYKIPPGSEPFFRPYVQAGSKFFVAKVNASKVKMENGIATLSPLRFHYDSEKFELPVRLGLVNSGGKQDLIVSILSPNARYEVANYPNVTIPTNLDIAESARGNFGEVYAALFDRTLEQNPKAVVTEYAWPASSCDPCPGGSTGLGTKDLLTLGADVLPSNSSAARDGGAPPNTTTRAGGNRVTGPLPPEVVSRIVRQHFGRFRICHDRALLKNPSLAGSVVTKLTIEPDGKTSNISQAGSISDPEMRECMTRAFSSITFPSESKPTNVELTTHFGIGVGSTGRLPQFVLTRLHARYGKDSLGADLVFKEADAIMGGREVRKEGKLEEGVQKATVNSFQARYAIRHPWPSKIECESPRRGIWGGPWPDAGTASRETLAATKTAYVPRGRVDVSKMFGNVALAAAPLGEPSREEAEGGVDAGATSGPSAGGKCGCRTPGGDAPIGAGAFIGLALAATALGRRLVCSKAR